jgi:hypothetical protein
VIIAAFAVLLALLAPAATERAEAGALSPSTVAPLGRAGNAPLAKPAGVYIYLRVYPRRHFYYHRYPRYRLYLHLRHRHHHVRSHRRHHRHHVRHLRRGHHQRHCYVRRTRSCTISNGKVVSCRGWKVIGRYCR